MGYGVFRVAFTIKVACDVLPSPKNFRQCVRPRMHILSDSSNTKTHSSGLRDQLYPKKVLKYLSAVLETRVNALQPMSCCWHGFLKEEHVRHWKSQAHAR